jgi:hypothetical protein
VWCGAVRGQALASAFGGETVRLQDLLPGLCRPLDVAKVSVGGGGEREREGRERERERERERDRDRDRDRDKQTD